MEDRNRRRGRYFALDELRGLVFISMVLYHGMWDLVYMFGHEIAWYEGTAGYVWQQSICWCFILLSGFCWAFGRNKYRHAGLVFGAGFLVTLVTCLFLPEDRVVFGVLTFLGTAAFLTTLLQPLLSRCRPAPGLIASIVLFVFTRNVNVGFLGFEGWRFLKLPEGLYDNFVTAFLGFPPGDFYSTDYFSLIPWLFLFLSGYFLYRCVMCSQKEEPLHFLKRGRAPALRWIGQRSLLLYLLHQPALYVLLHLWAWYFDK